MVKRGRFQVRAENPGYSCGKSEHMTVYDLKARAVHEKFDGTCPACGKFHFTEAEVDRLEKIKIATTEEYKKIEAQAMAGK